MKADTLSAAQALQEGQTLPYAMVRSLSKVYLGRTPKEIDTAELLEARFFNESRELRVFRYDGELKAAVLEQEASDNVLEETYKLKNTGLFGGSITVCKHLAADEDGQTYVAATRLSGWKEEV